MAKNKQNPKITLNNLAELGSALGLPKRASFEEDKSARLARDAETYRLCEENMRRAQEQEDQKPSHRSQFSQVSSIYIRAHENFTPINKQTVKGLSLNMRPKDKDETGGNDPSPSP